MADNARANRVTLQEDEQKNFTQWDPKLILDIYKELARQSTNSAIDRFELQCFKIFSRKIFRTKNVEEMTVKLPTEKLRCWTEKKIKKLFERFEDAGVHELKDLLDDYVIRVNYETTKMLSGETPHSNASKSNSSSVGGAQHCSDLTKLEMEVENQKVLIKSLTTASEEDRKRIERLESQFLLTPNEDKGKNNRKSEKTNSSNRRAEEEARRREKEIADEQNKRMQLANLSQQFTIYFEKQTCTMNTPSIERLLNMVKASLGEQGLQPHFKIVNELASGIHPSNSLVVSFIYYSPTRFDPSIVSHAAKVVETIGAADWRGVLLERAGNTSEIRQFSEVAAKQATVWAARWDTEADPMTAEIVNEDLNTLCYNISVLMNNKIYACMQHKF